jgi:CubicO group peptidase (beta-lactamase class C family)
MKEKKRWIVVGAAALLIAAAGTIAWAKREYIEELPIGCAFKAKALCAGIFVQGLSAATIEREDSGFDPAFGLMRAKIDVTRKSVTCSVLGLGLFARTAIYVEGLGPVLLSGRSEKSLRAMAPPPAPAVDPSTLDWPQGDRESAGPPPKLDSAALRAAMDGVFAETDPGRLKRTRAALVVYRGRIVAERYAPGVSKDTRLLSWSMAKSFTNALAGILVKRGKLDIRAPAPVPEWKRPGDPRGAITTDMLMRMSSGLAWEEDYTDHPVSDVNRMLFLEPDAAAYAASKALAPPPDSRWSYTSGSTNIVSRILRLAFRDEAEYLAFPRRELFDKIGMGDAVFGIDASGALIGSSYLHATARDYSSAPRSTS